MSPKNEKSESKKYVHQVDFEPRIHSYDYDKRVSSRQ